MFSGMRTEKIVFLVVQGQEILIFIGPGIENIDFESFGDSKY